MSRSQDEKRDKIAEQFFKETLFPEFIRFGLFEKFFLTPQRQKQINGIDAVLTVDGTDIPVDFKTRHSMTNKEIDSLAIEIRTNDRVGGRFTGWGIYPKHTRYWMFVHFIDAADGTTGTNCPITPDNIRGAIIEFIRPDEFHHWLETRGIPAAKLEKEAEAAEKEFNEKTSQIIDDKDIPYDWRKIPFDNFEYIENGAHKMSAFLSISARKGMDEDPTNLVLEEAVADKWPSSRRFVWTKDTGITEIKAAGRLRSKPLHM